MNTINWKPKALKQLEKIKETATRQQVAWVTGAVFSSVN